MSDNDDNESQNLVLGIVAGIVFAVVALVIGVAAWTQSQTTTESVAEIAPVGEALAKIYFAVGEATLNAPDKSIVAKTLDALTAKPDAIVLLSGFHDPSGDAAHNVELAKARAVAVRDALVTAGVATDRVKFRKPESTLGSGSAEEGRRVEIRVQ